MVFILIWCSFMYMFWPVLHRSDHQGQPYWQWNHIKRMHSSCSVAVVGFLSTANGVQRFMLCQVSSRQNKVTFNLISNLYFALKLIGKYWIVSYVWSLDASSFWANLGTCLRSNNLCIAFLQFLNLQEENWVEETKLVRSVRQLFVLQLLLLLLLLLHT